MCGSQPIDLREEMGVALTVEHFIGRVGKMLAPDGFFSGKVSCRVIDQLVEDQSGLPSIRFGDRFMSQAVEKCHQPPMLIIDDANACFEAFVPGEEIGRQLHGKPRAKLLFCYIIAEGSLSPS